MKASCKAAEGGRAEPCDSRLDAAVKRRSNAQLPEITLAKVSRRFSMFDYPGTLRTSATARPVRFALVGIAATLAHISVAGIVLWIAPKTDPYFVNLVAFGIAFFLSYFGHRYLTFARKGSLWKFFLVAIAGFACNNLLVMAFLAASASPFVAILVATAIVPVLTYLASSFWAFGKSDG